MLIAWKDNLTVRWDGQTVFGNLFVLYEDKKILHKGCFGYIRSKWKKMTGEILPN